MTSRNLLAATALVAGALCSTSLAPAGVSFFPLPNQVEEFVVRRFETGPREINYHRFFPVGGKGGTDVHRDDYLRFTFSDAVDMDTLNEQTIQVVAEDGTSAVAPGGSFLGPFSQDYVNRFDFGSGTFVPERLHRKRVVFDPTNATGPVSNINPFGFAADTQYFVILPGLDEGARETVKSRSGQPLARTFRTTFRTGSNYNVFFYDTPDYTDGAPPTVELIDGADVPGVGVDGRTDVAPRTPIVVHFSDPILRSSVRRRLRIKCPSGLSANPIRFRGRLSEDGMTCTFSPRRRLRAGESVTFRVPGATLAGRSGRYLPEIGPLTFQAATTQ